MKISMRNTAFRNATLAGLFLCVMALAGAFSGITTPAHAITASEVTNEDQLKEFVEEAVDEYYIKFLLQGTEEHCDFSELDLPAALEALIPTFLSPLGISDLTPGSMRMLEVDEVKGLIAGFNSPAVQSILTAAGETLDIWDACEEFPAASSFRDDVFGTGDGDWRSGSIYLFVLQYMDQSPEQSIIYHGQDMNLEGQELKGLKDGNERLILDLAESAAAGPVQERTEEKKGFFHYCWDDPTTEDDDLMNTGDLVANGDSWKISYVVDPFDYLGVPAPSDLPTILFGSGIYPKTGTPPEGCRIVGEMEPGDGDGTEPIKIDVTDLVDTGCAIAAGSDSAPLSNAFNLLLIVSALALAVSFGGRSAGRRNGIRS